MEFPSQSGTAINSSATTQRSGNLLNEKYKQILASPQPFNILNSAEKVEPQMLIFKQRYQKKFFSECKPNSQLMLSPSAHSNYPSRSELKPFIDRLAIEQEASQLERVSRSQIMLVPSLSEFQFDRFEQKFTTNNPLPSRSEFSYLRGPAEIFPNGGVRRKRSQKQNRNEGESRSLGIEEGRTFSKKDEIHKINEQHRLVRSTKDIAIAEPLHYLPGDFALPALKVQAKRDHSNISIKRNQGSFPKPFFSNRVIGSINEIRKEKRTLTIETEMVEHPIASVQLESELMQAFRYLKKLIANDQDMIERIHRFCFISTDEFCFLFGRFFDSIYATNTAEDGINRFSNRRSLCLQQAGVDRLCELVEMSFKAMNVQNINQHMIAFRVRSCELIPHTLLDELGGREFLKLIFYDFIEKMIESKEFLRDKYEENYAAILMALQTDERYLELACNFLANTTPDDSSIRIEIAEAIGMKLSSIDFLVLKKWIYHYLKEKCSKFLENVHSLVLRVISRINHLRKVVCNELVFIRNPDNFHRHIFLTIKNLMSSSAFLKPPTSASLESLTTSLIDYITLETTSYEFIEVLTSQFKDISHQKNEIDLLELAVTQACEIYSFLSAGDSADLAYKFEVLRFRLGIKKHVIQLLPTPLSVILSELSEWVETKITEDPLPKEILLKNLEDTELLELIIEFSRPEIDAFYHNDAFAAFSFYKITKMQFQFWITGLETILRERKVREEDIQTIKDFLLNIFPDNKLMKKQSFKLNEHSEQIYETAFKSASLSQINIPNDKKGESDDLYVKQRAEKTDFTRNLQVVAKAKLTFPVLKSAAKKRETKLQIEDNYVDTVVDTND